MQNDRYVKCVLTVIAIELAWLGAREFAVPVTAQAAATPVVITGIQVNESDGVQLPVVIVGSARQVPPSLAGSVERLTTRVTGAMQIDSRQPLKVELDRPVKVEADTPLPVDQVRNPPTDQPGL